MRCFILLAILFFSVMPLKAEMLDVDYNFIDTAFDGIKPVTNKEFDDTINRLTPQPIEDGFMGKVIEYYIVGRN